MWILPAMLLLPHSPSGQNSVIKKRADYLTKVADYLVEDAQELENRINLFTREHGKNTARSKY